MTALREFRDAWDDSLGDFGTPQDDRPGSEVRDAWDDSWGDSGTPLDDSRGRFGGLHGWKAKGAKRLQSVLNERLADS